MNRCVPLKARSEFAKARKFANRGSGGSFGSGGGSLGSRSGGVGAPAGAVGSKNPAGFGRLAIFSRFFAASPASRKPAFSPTRGSVVDCALAAATISATALTHHILEVIGTSSQSGTGVDDA